MLTGMHSKLSSKLKRAVEVCLGSSWETNTSQNRPILYIHAYVPLCKPNYVTEIICACANSVYHICPVLPQTVLYNISRLGPGARAEAVHNHVCYS